MSCSVNIRQPQCNVRSNSHFYAGCGNKCPWSEVKATVNVLENQLQAHLSLKQCGHLVWFPTRKWLYQFVTNMARGGKELVEFYFCSLAAHEMHVPHAIKQIAEEEDNNVCLQHTVCACNSIQSFFIAVLAYRYAFSYWALLSPSDSPNECCSLPLALFLTEWFYWADNSLHLATNELDCIYHLWLRGKLPTLGTQFNSGFCLLSARCKAWRKTSCFGEPKQPALNKWGCFDLSPAKREHFASYLLMHLQCQMSPLAVFALITTPLLCFDEITGVRTVRDGERPLTPSPWRTVMRSSTPYRVAREKYPQGCGPDAEGWSGCTGLGGGV